MTFKEKQIKLNDLVVNYVESGSGTPIIFLHNGGGFWHSWEHQIRYFTKDYHVFALDWPGFGKSEGKSNDLNLKLMTNTLELFINKKRLNDIILIGNCIGGSAALDYSIKHIEKIKKLVILNICPGDLIYPNKISRKIIFNIGQKKYLKFLFGWIFLFIATKTYLKKKFPRILFGNIYLQNDPLVLRYQSKLKERKQSDSRLNLFFSAKSYNLKPIIKNKKIPQHLLIWGSQNRVIPLEKLGLNHYNMLKSNSFEIIENAGHLCMYEKPAKVTKLIESYIN